MLTPGPSTTATSCALASHAERVADLPGQLGVPGRGERARGREAGGRQAAADPDVVAALGLAAQAVRPVGQHDRLDAVLGDRGRVPDVAAEAQRRLLLGGQLPRPVQVCLVAAHAVHPAVPIRRAANQLSHPSMTEAATTAPSSQHACSSARPGAPATSTGAATARQPSAVAIWSTARTAPSVPRLPCT